VYILKQYFFEVLYLLGEDRKKLKYLIVLFLGVSLLDLVGLGLVVPYSSLIIDPDSAGFFNDIAVQINLPQDKSTLIIFFGVVLISVFFIKTIAIVFVQYILTKFSQNQQARLRAVLLESYQNLSYTTFTQRNSADYVYNIHNLAEQFSNQVILVGLKGVSDIVVAIAIISLLAWNEPYILLIITIVFSSFVFGYDLIFGKKLKSYGACANKASTSILKNIHEAMEGLKEIRVLGKSSYFHARLKAAAKDYGYNQTMYHVLSTTPRYLLELIFISCVSFVAILVVFLEKDISGLFPLLGLYALAAMRLLPIVNGLTNSLTRLRYGRDAVSILYKDMFNIENMRNVEELKGAVKDYDRLNLLTLNQVKYKYPNTNKYVLKDISIEIRSGESIGIIGGSGAGKTTLVDLILGLVKPCYGEINYNGMAFDLQLKQWLSQVAYLPQQIFLVDDTLKANVALGCKIIDEDRVRNALKKAKLLNFVEQLSEGIDTEIGERGVRISGGQRQRVALARAFYHNRDILIMDESTSALDPGTEHEIVKEIQKYKGKRTVITIAHRLSTLQHCDRIYELQNGTIVNTGSYSDFTK